MKYFSFPALRAGLLCALLTAQSVAAVAQIHAVSLPQASSKIRIPDNITTNQTRNTGCDMALYADTSETTHALTAFVWDGTSTTTPVTSGSAIMCRFQLGTGTYVHSDIQQLGAVVIDGGLAGVVDDPDVVINRLQNGSTWSICVVYRFKPTTGNTRVYSEIWKYTEPTTSAPNGVLSLWQDPFELRGGYSTAVGTLSVNNTLPVTHPNVDAGIVSGVCYAIMVYEQNGNIFACTRNLSTPADAVTVSKAMSNVSNANTLTRNHHPDICIATAAPDGSASNSTRTITATYTFDGYATSSYSTSIKPQICTSSLTFLALTNSTPNVRTSRGSADHTVMTSGNFANWFRWTYGEPRITYRPLSGMAGKFCVAYEYRFDDPAPGADNARKIKLVTLNDLATGTGATIPTSAYTEATLYSYISNTILASFPAITTAEGSVMVAWRFLNSNDTISQFSEIIACSPGQEFSTDYSGPYWRVSSDPVGFGSLSYQAPSLARHLELSDLGSTSAFVKRNVLYFWYDEMEDNVPRMAYRSNYYSEIDDSRVVYGNPTNIIQAKQQRGLSLAPNPATPESKIGFSLAPNERVVSLTVHSLLTGQPVATATENQLLFPSSSTLADLLPANTPPGLYSARLTTTAGTTTTTFRFNR